jgi:Mrp family chromosome partitioning ATPase
MENIRLAVERAKERQGADPEQQGRVGPPLPQTQAKSSFGVAYGSVEGIQEVELDAAYLQSRRIASYDEKNLNCRSFDMLRTQVLQTMEQKGWKILAVTSPTSSCGKTLTAINLALSIARQPERSVLLVDMDLRKPQVADCLGLIRDEGVLGVLEGRVALASAIIRARVGNCKFEVLPTASTPHSSDLMSSSAMSTLLHDLRIDSQSRIVILDLPPLLSSDDVIAILPQVDCALLVTAVGTSTVSEIEECNKHLQSTDLVRFVLNKVPQSDSNYQYY